MLCYYFSFVIFTKPPFSQRFIFHVYTIIIPYHLINFYLILYLSEPLIIQTLHLQMLLPNISEISGKTFATNIK